MVATARPLIQPNAQNQYEVTAEDLPLACPRVYLPIQDTGWAKCPYCSAEFTLRK